MAEVDVTRQPLDACGRRDRPMTRSFIEGADAPAGILDLSFR